MWLAFNKKKIIPKFTNFYEVVSFDATSFFTSINVSRVVDYIIGKIYENPDIFFGEDNLDNFPPQLILKEFMLGVLLKFSAFTTLNGFYRQTEGLAMGSKLSPAISNIFLHMLETTTITELLDQKILLFYSRYVDDCLLLVRKRAKNNILSKMNTFDSFLKFTVEEMQNDVLVYLDTKLLKMTINLNLCSTVKLVTILHV